MLVVLTTFSVYVSLVASLNPQEISWSLALACLMALAFYFAAPIMPGNTQAIQLTSLAITGLASFILSFSLVAETGYSPLLVLIPASILFLALVKIRESTFSLILFGVMVLRIYFTTLYDYLPKSLAFIIAGLIIIGVGYWILKLKKGGEQVEQP